jgi:hypothetical protein
VSVGSSKAIGSHLRVLMYAPIYYLTMVIYHGWLGYIRLALVSTINPSKGP